ncbi:tetraspanin-19-like isoform X2 [Diospyros lotus]|uniref:tetraspanin-19-like isoform X2 n=1 Tax=Diospyros lotus TaxID=55363 RepID=UPI00224FB94A|nr:tetraspanin-19-like isoform X2 [Diospyros lotus]
MLPQQWSPPCGNHCTKKYASLLQIPCLEECNEICYKDPVLKDQQWSAYIDRSPGAASYSEECFRACVAGCGYKFFWFITMPKTVKGCLQLLLKLVNSTLGLVGHAMILYSIWMVRVWQRDMEDSSFSFSNLSLPWFIHVFLGTGITLCAITCLGHIAADTANPHCLSCYIVVIFVLLLTETLLVADIILNSNWEKDLPEDPTGRFDDFKDFVKSNFDTCKWIGLFIISAQVPQHVSSIQKINLLFVHYESGFSILLATVLRTLNTDVGRNYCSDDDDYAPPRLPLLNHHVQPLPYEVADFPFASRNETWRVRKDSQ